MSNVAKDKKKSDFTAQTVVPSGTYFDFVLNGQNYKISASDMIAAFGTTGTISQKGDPTQTPILNIDGTDNQIRNLEDGSGVKASISPNGGALLDHNFQQDSTGAQILKNITAASPEFRSIVAGSGISVAEQNGFIQIAVSGTPVTTKTVIVNEEADFPTPVLGVITLEDDKSYFITNDITTANRFVLGSNTVVEGEDGTLITLTYSGSGTMFTSVDNSNKIRDIICSCTSGTFLDVSCSVGGSIFQILNSRVNCDTIGTVDGVSTVLFDMVAWAVTTDGITFQNALSLIAFTQNIGTISAGTFVDLGTCTTDGFTFINSQGTLSAGATFLSGAASSANINAGGLATVLNTRALGSGTALNGITTKDTLWEFFGNNGIDDSRTDCLLYNNGTTVTIAAANTPVQIGATWTEVSVSRFTTAADGTVTYVGKGDSVTFNATISATVTGTGPHDSTFYWAVNGSTVAASSVPGKLDNADAGNLSLLWAGDLSTNDTVSVWVENNDNNEDIVITKAVIRID